MNEAVKNDMGRIETYIREHKRELIIGAIGFGLGVMFTKRKFRNHISGALANELLQEVFKDAGGDFTKAAGGYMVPQIKWVS